MGKSRGLPLDIVTSEISSESIVGMAVPSLSEGITVQVVIFVTVDAKSPREIEARRGSSGDVSVQYE